METLGSASAWSEAGSGGSKRSRQRSTDTWALPGATQHELQSDLQMAAACAGLAGAQERPGCEPSQAAFFN